MNFDHIFNVQACFEFIRDVAPMSLVYYSHFISLGVSLFLGIIVWFYGGKTLAGKLLFGLSFVFSLWVVSDLVTWISYNSMNIVFVWSFLSFLTALIYIICIYFTYTFIYNRNIPLWMGSLFFVLLIPVFILTPTVLNLSGFSNVDCISIESTIFTNYCYMLGVFAFVFILFIAVHAYIKNETIAAKKQIILMVLGVEAFILIFFTATFVDSYIVNAGYTGDYLLSNYGLFGIVIFMAMLTFLIVRFKAFNIKLLGAQALVWTIIILVGSQLFFIKTRINFILTSVTLVITIISGIILVRSVKRVDEQRSTLAKINESQQVLIRFVTHQVKGAFTKSKMIFASFLEGDLGPISPEAKDIVQQGMDSDNLAVDMIQNILNASNLKTGKTQFTFESVDFVDYVKHLIEPFKERIEQKRLSLDISLPSFPINTHVDKTQLSQVVNNLIDNAINYTISGGLKINVYKRGYGEETKIYFSIQDTGIGLSQKDKDNLFHEGGRGEESVKVNVNSTGYGLFIVKKIVENHHGEIWAESAGRDKGATFIFEIPEFQNK